MPPTSWTWKDMLRKQLEELKRRRLRRNWEEKKFQAHWKLNGTGWFCFQFNYKMKTRCMLQSSLFVYVVQQRSLFFSIRLCFQIHKMSIKELSFIEMLHKKYIMCVHSSWEKKEKKRRTTPLSMSMSIERQVAIIPLIFITWLHKEIVKRLIRRIKWISLNNS